MVVAVGIMESIITEDDAFEPMPAAHWKELAHEQHAELGLVLADRWELATIFTEVITQHHDLPDDPPLLLELVHTVDLLISLLNETPHINEEVLEPIFPLEEERQVIWSRLSSVCSLVAALSQPPKTRAKNYCSAAHTKIDTEAAREAGFPVTLQTSPPKDYTAFRMDSEALQIDGDTAQQAGTLLKIALNLDLEQLELWAKVRASHSQAGGHRVELIPFGMDDDAKARWDRVLRWLEVPREERPPRIQKDMVADLIEQLGGQLSPAQQKVALARAASLISELEKRKVSGDELNELANLKKARKQCEAGEVQAKAPHHQPVRQLRHQAASAEGAAPQEEEEEGAVDEPPVDRHHRRDRARRPGGPADHALFRLRRCGPGRGGGRQGGQHGAPRPGIPG